MPQSLRAMPLGTLGTGAVEVCSDGRFRNLTINNNRTVASRIPSVPHSFLAVSVTGSGGTYTRKLQTPQAGGASELWLPEDGLQFRAQFPLADCRVRESGAPVDVVWSAFAPVVPYDYDASALPLIYLGMQITNVCDEVLSVSALLNWQNTCGCSATVAPENPVPIQRDTLITQGDLDRIKGQAGGDNERRLSSKTGHIESSPPAGLHVGDVPPNALVFGDARAVDANEDGQYCVATPWSPGVKTVLRIWDPTDPAEEAAFWGQLRIPGGFEDAGYREQGQPHSGAVCNQFRLEPGQTRSVEFVVTWYCPRYVVNGTDEGNFYANNHSDARAVARVGLANSKYYFAAITGWQQRLAASDLPGDFVKRLLASCEALCTNSIHTRNGAFGLFDSPSDPRVNYLRDRWFWSMGLLLFYPRLELDILDRLSLHMMDGSGRSFRISEGMEGFGGGEFVSPGAAQVEVCAHLVIMTWRNFLFGGSLSFLARLVPRLQVALAAIIAQDKDFDGFPDLQHEAPGLDCAFASGLNVMTAGLWIVALAAGERMARRQKLPEAVVYKQALDRALRSFERYFWNSEFGYYTLYPDPRFNLSAETDLQTACHSGQLHPFWIAELLGLDGLFPPDHMRRALNAVEAHNLCGGPIALLSWPSAGDEARPRWSDQASVQTYSELRYRCCRRQLEPATPLLEVSAVSASPISGSASRHVSALAWWYLIMASPVARLDLADKCLLVRPDLSQRGQKMNYTLYTPNGFGAVSVRVKATGVLQCQVEFRMDIPQEIASIQLALPAGLGEPQCRLELEDGPVPVNVNIFPAGADVRVEIFPESRLSASAFTLQFLVSDAAQENAPSKSQWIPRWLRR